MRVQLEVDSHTAEKLRQIAAAQKVSLEKLLATYIPGLVPENREKNGVEENDKVRAFEEWAESFPSGDSPLSDEAVSRRSIYRDR